MTRNQLQARIDADPILRETLLDACDDADFELLLDNSLVLDNSLSAKSFQPDNSKENAL